jgi:DNA-directed RNA polymerase specialized sigma subunit
MATAELKLPRSKPAPDYFVWKSDPTPENYSKLVQSLEPTIRSALYSFAGNNPSLMIRAHILTNEAIQSFDSTRGASLSTHLFNHLRRLERIRAQRNYIIHIPENVRVDSRLVKNFVTEYVDRNGVDPSHEQIADNLGMSKKRIQKAFSAGQEVSESVIMGEKGDIFSQEKARTASDMWSDYVYHDLDETGKKIYEWSTGYNGAPKLPKNEIAKKLKISPPAVSSRISTIIKKLEEYDE